MSSIEALKEQARRHEKKEEWKKALEFYSKAIEELDEEEQPDIGLYNRVGDLCTRTGEADRAVQHYERAVDLYMEAELANNAIAVCKKIIRNLPDRHSVYLKMGQIRADQGFLVDARNNFLTYAERVQGDGDLDEALRALGEFADLAPEDTDIRMAIAAQYQQHERPEEAIAQLAAGYAVLVQKGDMDGASAFETQAREIDPDADLASYVPAVAESAGGEVDLGFESTALAGDDYADDSAVAADFGDIGSGADVEEAAPEVEVGGDFDLSSPDADEEAADELPAAVIEADADTSLTEVEVAGEFGEIEIGLPEDSLLGEDDEDEDEGGELPLMSFDDETDDAESEDDALAGALDLSGIDLDSTDELGAIDEDDDEDLGGDLPLMSFDDDEDAADAVAADEPVVKLEASGFGEVKEVAAIEETGPVEEVASAEASAPAESPREAFERLRAEAEASPEDLTIPQQMVEVAFRTADDSVMATAYLTLAQTLQRTGAEARAKAVFQQVLSIEPTNPEALAALEAAGAPTREVKEVAASEDYVDLGSLILGDEEEKTTRFVVAYEEPSGDEAADFKKMLSQFKEKVAENFDSTDVKAHHDLGTAYKEMGLLDEAIEEFQQALRAAADHLPTYELLGQVFMEKGENEAAVRVLTRALEVEFEVEDELLGIYYYLGRAHQDLGQKAQAVDFYDRVFALDINFADVTERLRTLR